MNIIHRRSKPRNPFVALARSRHAGSHRPSKASQRQRAGRALQSDIQAMKENYP